MGDGGRRVRVETFADRVPAVVLDRPPVKAADEELLAEVREAFESMHERDVDAVVLTGAGRHFCGGNDLHEFAAMDGDEADRLMRNVRRAFWALYDCPVPVVAAVNGAALAPASRWSRCATSWSLRSRPCSGCPSWRSACSAG